MNRKKMLVPFLLALFGGAGCATLPPGDLKPVTVGTGDTEDFDAAGTILFFPAGKPLPFHITASGSIFAKPIDHTETFVLNRDIYLWRDKVSFDGKNWRPASAVFNGSVEFFFNPKNVRFSAVYDLE